MPNLNKRAAPSLVIHIGMEKTGTTSIQAFLRQNANALCDQSIWYPDNKSATYVQGNAHFPLAGSMLTREPNFVSPEKWATRTRCVNDLLEDQGQRAELTTIISAEHFSSRLFSQYDLMQFRDKLRTVYSRIIIVVYVRDQVSLAISSYSTAVMSGWREAFDEKTITPHHNYFNVLSLLNRWAAVFGKECVIPREYLPEKLVDGDICKDFCSLIGIDVTKMTFPARLNETLSADKIELLRLVNQWLPQFNDDPENWRDGFDLKKTYIIPFLESPNHLPVQITPQERINIISRFKTDNETLNNEYFYRRLSRNWFALTDETIDRHKHQQMPAAEAMLSKSIINFASELRTITLKNNKLTQELRTAQRRLIGSNIHRESQRMQLESIMQRLTNTEQQLALAIDMLTRKTTNLPSQNYSNNSEIQSKGGQSISLEKYLRKLSGLIKFIMRPHF